MTLTYKIVPSIDWSTTLGNAAILTEQPLLFFFLKEMDFRSDGKIYLQYLSAFCLDRLSSNTS